MDYLWRSTGFGWRIAEPDRAVDGSADLTRRSIFARPQQKLVKLTQARRWLRLTLLAPAVVEPLLANPDVAINLESVLRPVMPLDWRAQGAVFARA